MKITFLGAAETVTGSKYLLECADKKILLDCGLFQGLKPLRLRNWKKFPVDPASIDAVILSHAHIDHSGCVPLLVKSGYKGKIYCSPGTYDLCSILLPDSGYLHEEDARRSNKYKYTKHHPALPLYTQQDAIESLQSFETVDFGVNHKINNNISFVLHHASHIIGASTVQLTLNGKIITFSGDLGRPNDPLLYPPDKLTNTDYLVIESTYGDRLHTNTDPKEDLKDIITETYAKGGSVIIPAFAVGRTQAILYYIYQLKESGEIPDIKVFLDSPMAQDATDLLKKYCQEHKLSNELCHDFCQIAKYTKTVNESKYIDSIHEPIIIISASGMAEGGRILHHLKYFMSDPKNTILFTGYQAEGTRGDRMVRGEQDIKIHGEMHKVRARVENLHNMSAHADYSEILSWLKNFKKSPRKVFITHGEIKAANNLKKLLEDEFNWQVCVPKYLETHKL